METGTTSPNKATGATMVSVLVSYQLTSLTSIVYNQSSPHNNLGVPNPQGCPSLQLSDPNEQEHIRAHNHPHNKHTNGLKKSAQSLRVKKNTSSQVIEADEGQENVVPEPSKQPRA